MLNNDSNLKINTASLQEILNTINNLPETSSGSSFDTITIRSETEGYVNGIQINPNVDTEVPVSLSYNIYPIFYSFTWYNVSITFTVARTGESYTYAKDSSSASSIGSFNLGGQHLISFIPGDTIIVSGVSDF